MNTRWSFVCVLIFFASFLQFFIVNIFFTFLHYKLFTLGHEFHHKIRTKLIYLQTL